MLNTIALLFSTLLFMTPGVFTDGVFSPNGAPDGPAIASPKAQSGTTIMFSGYEWEVTDGLGAPHAGDWATKNAWVDEQGRLHLKLNYQNNQWKGAQVMTKNKLGFGTYQFQVTGPIDQLDPNVVFGMFNYEGHSPEAFATNEIDIEFGKWGHDDVQPGSYTIWPNTPTLSNRSKPYSFKLKSLDSTHRFRWNRKYVYYQSLHGHRSDHREQFANWWLQPSASTAATVIPQKPLNLYINIWAYKGRAPKDGKECEIIIKKFTHTPG